jgi:4-hydroxybenzoate polyprenyltransferase
VDSFSVCANIGSGHSENGVQIPICIDLDGTLVQGDLFLESILGALRSNCFLLFLFPIWLGGGIANLKAKVSAYHCPRPELLPYNKELLEFLKRKKEEGHKLYLTTAAAAIHAKRVADHLTLFDGVLASTAGQNLKGERKLDAIGKLLGTNAFLYAGNSRSDLPIWRESAGAITVNTPVGAEKYLDKNRIPIAARFPKLRSWWTAAASALRPHQWVKNALVFMPLLLAHQLFRTEKLVAAAVAFAAFSFCASSFYVLNDLLDIEPDRAHPRKKSRPFASGVLGVRDGLLLMVLAATASVACAWFLPVSARRLLAIYAVVNLCYSARLKQFLFLDAIVLAFLYTLRLLVGGRATHIEISVWTLAFSIFFFLGLALLKRLTELATGKNQVLAAESRRAYTASDIAPLNSFASSALYLSVLIAFLYINSPDVAKLYRRPEALWFVSLPLLYWIGRLLMLANRGLMSDDPIVFAFKDPASYLVGLAILACALLAT